MFSFFTEKAPNIGPQGLPSRCSERSKIGNKNNRILEPEKVTKMSSKWLPFGDLGPNMVSSGGGLGALWGAHGDFYQFGDALGIILA